MPSTRRPQPHPGRRALLAGLGGVGLAALTGCDIRVADDGPDLPGLEKQSAPADQAGLQRLLAILDAAHEAAADSDSAWAGRLARIHATQQTRLRAVMATQGMQATASSTAATSSGSAASADSTSATSSAVAGSTAGASGSPTPTSSAASSALSLPTAERRGFQFAPASAAITRTNRPMASAIVVTMGAACRVLGSPATLSGAQAPSTAVIRQALPSLRQAVYGMEVIAAKTAISKRTRVQHTLTVLLAARSAWEAAAGSAAPTEPDGYDLAVSPTSEANRTRLARTLLTDLVTALAATSNGSTAPTAAEQSGLLQLWSDALGLAWQWGTAPDAFPGLRTGTSS